MKSCLFISSSAPAMTPENLSWKFLYTRSPVTWFDHVSVYWSLSEIFFARYDA